MARTTGRNGGADRITVEAPGSEFARGERARRGMRPEARRVMALGVSCAAVVLLAMLLPAGFWSLATYGNLTPAMMLERVANNLEGLLGVFSGNGAPFESRFMAVVVCAVSGAALGLCGSTYQGAFNNPLAAPKTLGVMAGGALGALIYVVFLQDLGPQFPLAGSSYTLAQYYGWLSSLDPGSWFWAQYGQCICSIAGCFAVVGIVMAITATLGRGRMSNVVVIIFGTVFSATVTALISFARYYYTSMVANAGIDIVDELRAIENYTMVNEYGFRDLLIIVLPLVVCMVVVLLMRRRLTLLSFGDDEAASMGVNVNRSRYVMIAVCTLMVAIAISFCGHVAFLGFISAHLARRIVGPDFRFLLPASIFTGAGLLTVIQYLCQSGLPFANPYSAGMVCSVLGSLLFMGLILAQRGKGGAGGWR